MYTLLNVSEIYNALRTNIDGEHIQNMSQKYVCNGPAIKFCNWNVVFHFKRHIRNETFRLKQMIHFTK